MPRQGSAVFGKDLIKISRGIKTSEEKFTVCAYSCRIVALYSMSLATESCVSSRIIEGVLVAIRARTNCCQSIAVSSLLSVVKWKSTQRDHIFRKRRTVLEHAANWGSKSLCARSESIGRSREASCSIMSSVCHQHN